MQFNYLGGQSNRDTLSQALGQRNPVLEGQLDFTKSAFVTGVQGAGQTMRTAMGLDQQQKESVLRSKTAREEGALNRQSSKDLLTEKLAADETEFDRRFDLEGQRNEDQRKTADGAQRAAERRALVVQTDKERREALEYDRKIKGATTANDDERKRQEALTGSNITGEIGALRQTWDAKMASTDFKDWVIDQKSAGGRYSPTARKMEDFYKNSMSEFEQLTDVNAKKAFLERFKADGNLDFGAVRGLFDGAYKAQALKEAKDSKSGTPRLWR